MNLLAGSGSGAVNPINAAAVASSAQPETLESVVAAAKIGPDPTPTPEASAPTPPTPPTPPTQGPDEDPSEGSRWKALITAPALLLLAILLMGSGLYMHFSDVAKKQAADNRATYQQVADQRAADKASSDINILRVRNLTATTAKFQDIQVTGTATINSLLAQVAQINQLDATDTTTQTLVVRGATTSSSTNTGSLNVSGNTTLAGLTSSGQVRLTGNSGDVLIIQAQQAGQTLVSLRNASGTEVTSLDSSGNLSLGGNANVAGTLTVPTAIVGDLTANTATIGTLIAGGQGVFTAIPSGSGVNQGTVYINPASANAGDTLLGLAVAGAEKLRVDSSGNFSNAGNLGTAGNLTVAGTSSLTGQLNVAGPTVLGSTLQAASTISAVGDINTNGMYTVNGVQISSANLSNDANLAKLNGTQTFTGANTFTAPALFQNASNSSTAFRVLDAGGGSLINANTTATTVGVGGATSVYTLKVTNTTTGKLAALGVNNADPNQLADVVNFQTNGVNNLTINYGGRTTIRNTTNSTSGFSVVNAAAGSVFNLDTVNSALTANTSATFKNQADSTTAFQIQNAAGAKLFNVDTLNSTVAIGNGNIPSLMSLPGVAGSYANTPDSATTSITGDIDIRVRLAMNDWTPATNGMIMTKWATSGQSAYRLYMATTGRMIFTYSPDGTTPIALTSSSQTGFVDGTAHWVRVTRSAATGEVIFYTASDLTSVPSSWTQLGSIQTGATGSMFDSTADVEVGAAIGGAFSPLAANVYQALIYNGINGTAVANFDPTRAASLSDTTFTATTGEVWTRNGSAAFLGSNSISVVNSLTSLYGPVMVQTLSGTAGSVAVCRNADNQLATCTVNPDGVTLQQAYNASAGGVTPEILLDATRGGLTIADAASPIGAALLSVTNNAGDFNYFSTSAAGTNITGPLTLGRIAGSGTVTQGSLLFADGTTDNFGLTLNTSTLTANRTITLPNESGTVCTTGSVCTGYAPASGSGNYVQNGTALQANANFNIQSAAAGSIGGIIRGATGQTADLFDLQSSGGGNLLSVNSDGTLNTLRRINAGTSATPTGTVGSINATPLTTASVGLVVRGLASQTGNLLELQNSSGTALASFSSAGVLTAPYANIGSIGIATSGAQNIESSGAALGLNAWSGQNVTIGGANATTNLVVANAAQIYKGLYVTPGATSTVGVVVRGAAGQTANLAEYQTNAITTLSGVDASGNFFLNAGQSLKVTGSTAFPSSPTEGQVYYRTDNKQLYTYANGKWQADRSTSTLIVAASNTQNKEKADYVGDGTNDQTAINAAIAALPSTGGSVVLLDGTYNIAGTITMNKANVNLTGQGNSTVLKRMYNESAAATGGVITITTASNSVSQLKIDGNKATYSSVNNYGVFNNAVAFTANYNKLINNTIVNTGGNGIYMYGNATLQNTNQYISGNTVTGSGNHGIYSNYPGTNASGYVITGNVVSGNAGSGIVDDASGQSLAVTGNTAYNNTGSGFMIGSPNSTVTGNTSRSNGGSGFDNISASTFSGNTAVSNTSHGFAVTMGANATLTGNISKSNGGSGIFCYYSANFNGQALIANNNVASNSLNGILLNAAFNQSTVTGNEITDNGGSGNSSGIVLNANAGPPNAIQVTNNTITDTAGTGYAISLSANNTYLADNTYSGTGASSIQDLGAGTIYANQRDSNGNIVVRGQAGVGINTSSPTASLQNTGALVNSAVATPAAPTVAAQGTAGATTWAYRVTAYDGIGETLASTATSIANGNATLDGTNFNRITPVRVNGAVSYKIYRTTAGGTPATTGLIGTLAGGAATFQFDDTGLAATTAVPTVNTTGSATIANFLGINNATPANRLNINSATTADSLAQALIATGSATNKGLVLQGAAGQTADLLQVQKSDGTVYASIGGTGAVLFQNTNFADAFRVKNGVGTDILNLSSAGNGSIAIGINATASTATGHTIAIGNTASATGGNTIAIGAFSSASNSYANAFGKGATASGLQSTAVGGGTASGDYSTSLGNGAAGAKGSIIIASGVNNFWGLANNIVGSTQIGMDGSSGNRDGSLYVRGGGFTAGNTPGTVSNSAAGTTVTGVGTSFTQYFIKGDRITIGSETRTVTTINTDTSLVVDTAFANANSPGTAYTILPALFKIQKADGTAKLYVNDQGFIGINTFQPASTFAINTATTADSLAQAMIATGAATNKGLVIQAAASQTANLFELQNSSGTVLSKFDSAGNLTVGSSSNVLTISSPGAGSQSEHFGAGSTTGSSAGSTAIGFAASSTGAGSLVVGANASAAQSNSVAVGGGAIASGAFSGGVAVGTGATVGSSDGNIAIGLQAVNNGSNATAIGRYATVAAGNNGSIALGFQATTNASNQLVIGSSTTNAYAITNAFIGNGVTNATPLGFTLQSTGGSGPDTAGAALSLAGGKGTGSATGGGINLQVATPTTVNTSFVAASNGPRGVAVNGSYMYWTNANGSIGRSDLAGTNVNQTFIAGVNAHGLAVDSNYIYWTNNTGNAIGRADIGGTNVNTTFITGLTGPYGIAVNANYIYWTNNIGNSIGRSDIDGTNLNNSFVTGMNGPIGITVDATYLYWANYNSSTIGRSNLDGSSPSQSFITGTTNPAGVAVNGSYIYWSNYGNSTLGRAQLAGTNPVSSWVSTANNSNPVGLAINGSYLYWAGFSSTAIGRASIGSSTATGLSTVASLSGFDGSALFKNSINSTTAFQVQTSAGIPVLKVDTTGTNNNVFIGGGNTATNGSALAVDTTVYSGTGFISNVFSRPYVNTAGAIGGAIAYRGAVRTINAATVLGGAYAFYADSPLVSGGSITNSYGMYIDPQKVTGVTNGYGIYQVGTTDTNYYNAQTNTFRSGTNNSAAFNVQNASAVNVFNVDTTAQKVTVRSGTDAATLGSELIAITDFTDSAWTTTNWTPTSTTATHVTGNTSALSTNQFAPVAASSYVVSYTITAPTVGTTLTVSLGGATVRTYTFASSATITDSVQVTAANAGVLTFTPSSTFTGVISAVSVKQITFNNSPALAVLNSAGGVNIEVRTSSSATSTLIGLGSGKSLTTGNNLTSLGYTTLQNNTTGYNNTAVGSQALSGNTTGFNNTALGTVALRANTTGSNNVAVGSSALGLNTVGNANVAVGVQALNFNTTGSENVAIGSGALVLNTSGGANVAIGGTAVLANNTTGGINTAVGYQAMNSNTSGNWNSALGWQALSGTTTGYSNTALGTQSLAANTTGLANTGVGTAADVLFNNLTGATAIGFNSKVGSSNTVVVGASGNKVSIGANYANGASLLSVGAGTYSTGTIQQTTTTVTGTGTAWTSGMVGGTIYYSDGTSATVSSVNVAAQTMVVNVSKTVAALSTYALVWGGNNTSTTGSASIQNTADSTAEFAIQRANGTKMMNVDSTNVQLSVNAYSVLSGGLTIQGLTPPTASVSNVGAAGSTTYTYVVIACTNQGNFNCSAGSTAVSTTTGNAVLDGTNFNRVSWAPVAGAKNYTVFRTVSDGSPATIGRIVFATTALSIDDTGLAGNGGGVSGDSSANLVVGGGITAQTLNLSNTTQGIEGPGGGALRINAWTAQNVSIGASSGAGLDVAGTITAYNTMTAVAKFVNTGAGNGVNTYGALFKNSADSATAFEIQTQGATSILSVNSSTLTVTVKNLVVATSLKVNGHIITGNTSGSTTGAVQAAAGSSATCTVTGNDTGGKITIASSGTGQAAGAQCVITFAGGYATTPSPVVAASNSNAATLDPYSDATLTTFTVYFATAPTAGQSYTLNYFNTQ